MRDKGLTPWRVGNGIATGHQRLEIYRQETQVADFDLEPGGRGFMASLEVKIVVEPPGLGRYEIGDLVTTQGDSLEGALTRCAETFMEVTYPPLEALFTGRRPEGPGTGTFTITSFTVGLDRGFTWDVVLGPLQLLNDPDGALRQRLKERPPATLVLDAITGHLHEPRLHWCKLYGRHFAARGLKFAVSIDGRKDPSPEAEMAQKFGPPPPGEWEFRQFLAIRHTGDADETTTAELRGRAATTFGEERPSPKGWWSRLFGRA
jgi:hypothetical protein